jgi:DNA polymerase I-like protein with 3'-5' exonuclease and polymerase domains
MIYVVGNVPDSHQYVQTKFDHFLDWIKVQTAYQLDLETNITKTALGRIIRTIQFGEVRLKFNEPGVRFVIVWDDLTALQRDKIAAVLSNPRQQKMIHNATFEYQTLLNYGIILEGVVDTMLQEQIKWAGYFTGADNENGDSFFSLAGTLHRYFQIVLDKSYQAAFVPGIPLTPGHIVYAADDVTHLDLLNSVQVKFLESEGLMNVRNLENEAVLAFSDISWNGMMLDKEKWLDNLSKAEPEVLKYKKLMDEWLTKDPILERYAREHEIICSEDTVSFNKNSPNQKLELVTKLFPDIAGATKPIITKYLKDKGTELDEERQLMLSEMRDGDYTRAYVHLAHFHRDWLIEMGYLRPEGHISINWNSVDQVLPMFQKLDKKLKDLSEKSRNTMSHPIIADFEKYKSSLKLLNAYGLKFLDYVDMDGKVRTTFNQVLNTGRVSSKQPNMQQIPLLDEDGPDPYRYRNAFIPSDPDNVFVDSDYSSQELVTIAEISRDPVWLDALARGKDLHSVCAHMMYGKKWEEGTEPGCKYFELVGGEPRQKKCSCKKHKTMRYDTKTIDFGLAYGMSQFKLAGELKISVKEAEDLIARYFTTFPSIGKCLTNLGGYGVQLGYIKTLAPFNRKRWFPEWDKVQDRVEYHIKRIQYNGILGTIERASKNLPIQGSCADMMKYALVLIRRYINDNGLRHKVKLVMQVHDQATTECHKDFAEEWKEIMTRLMEKAAKLIITSGILRADTNISPVWTK